VAGRQCGEVDGVTEPLAGFAGLLGGLRVEAGLTQEELAEAAEVSVRGSPTWRAGR
jgi:hypothetical protein